jgi:hypothetical protein
MLIQVSMNAYNVPVRVPAPEPGCWEAGVPKPGRAHGHGLGHVRLVAL